MSREKHRQNLPFQTWIAWLMKQGSLLQAETAGQAQKYVSQDVERPNFSSFPEEFLTAINDEADSRFHDFLKGIDSYQTHPYKRLASDPPILWQRGATRVLDYGDSKNSNAPIAVCIPSLVNRSYIFDLSKENSMLRYLSRKDIHPILVDWGDMSGQERTFDLTDYIEKDLKPILELLSPRPIYLVGYCMGGLMATALAQITQKIKGLVLLATPWNFHTDNTWMVPYLHASSDMLEQAIDLANELPGEVIQLLFNSLNPMSFVKKFRSLGQSKGDAETLNKFAAVEDWLNDCVPLAPKVAKECLFGWYRDNAPHLGAWKVAGQTIRPEKLHIPSLAIIPQRDVVVPPDSAQALAHKLPSCHVVKPQLGHIGLMVGRSARKEVWDTIAHFISANP